MINLNCCKLLFTCLISTYSLYGTIGYFDIGYGTKCRGMGGVAVAFPQDSVVSAINPAGMIWVGNRVDAGCELFTPKRQTTYSGSLLTQNRGGLLKSHSNIFLVPHAGINTLIHKDLSFGCSLYSNGGLNTNYADCNVPSFGPCGPLGGNLLQLIISPTISKRICGTTSFGVSPLFGVQAFKARGLQNFTHPLFSQHPCNVTNRAHNIVPGVGGRLGFMHKITDHINIGLSYATKIYFKNFELYKGLFAQEGKFDIPATIITGIAIENIHGFTLGFDFQYIYFSKVPAISNSIAQVGLPFNQNIAAQNKLGSACGPGFGWQSVPIYKLGLLYDGYKNKIFRIGYAHGNVPFSSLEVDFNILAPAVIKDHITGGFTLKLNQSQEIDTAFVWAFKHKVTGQSQLGLGCVELQMYQFGFEFNYGYKF